MQNKNYEWLNTEEKYCWELRYNYVTEDGENKDVKIFELIQISEIWFTVLTNTYDYTFSAENVLEAKEKAMELCNEKITQDIINASKSVLGDSNDDEDALVEGEKAALIASIFLPNNINWKYDNDDNTYVCTYDDKTIIIVKGDFHDNGYFVYAASFDSDITGVKNTRRLYFAETIVRALQNENLYLEDLIKELNKE